MEYITGYNCQIENLSEIYLNYFNYITTGYFVEAGAYDGYTYSNTWGLAKIGWKGLYFEPFHEFYTLALENHKDHLNVKVINKALSDTYSLSKLFVGGPISTLKKSRVEMYNILSWTKGFHVGEEVFVDTTLLGEELKQNSFPKEFEVLSLDIEGSEMDVLNSFDIAYWKPKMVIIEACEKHSSVEIHDQTDEINNYFDKNSYYKIHCDEANNIYVKYPFYTDIRKV